MKCHTACDELYFVWEVRPVQTRWLVRMNFWPCNVPVIFLVNFARISCSNVQMKEMECKFKIRDHHYSCYILHIVWSGARSGYALHIYVIGSC